MSNTGGEASLDGKADKVILLSRQRFIDFLLQSPSGLNTLLLLFPSVIATIHSQMHCLTSSENNNMKKPLQRVATSAQKLSIPQLFKLSIRDRHEIKRNNLMALKGLNEFWKQTIDFM